MSNNDQWFEPGDKVMRVHQTPFNGDNIQNVGRWPAFGELACVSQFEAYDSGNAVVFVGYPPVIEQGEEWWEIAADFRKVEEIRLCVDALKHSKSQEFQTH